MKQYKHAIMWAYTSIFNNNYTNYALCEFPVPYIRHTIISLYSIYLDTVYI